MPVIEPIPTDELATALQAEIARGLRSRYLSTPVPPQIWGHVPEAATAWLRTMGAFHDHGPLDERTRELVRLHIASFTQCESCQVARKTDAVTADDIVCLSADDPRFTPREQSALRFAQRFSTDYFAIEDDVFADLAQHFSVEEIVDLAMFSAFMFAGGRLNYVLRGYADDEKPTLLSRSATV
jgi:alkylhydroperoxidase family enzyme